jgi:hypothetical protein
MFAASAEPDLKTAAPEETSDSFVVSLEEFSGPFDVLLSLIAKHRLDVTALSLHQVTDDFLAYIKARGDEWTLDEATEFLVIAATLLDLKAARLIPGGEVEDEEDIAVLEGEICCWLDFCSIEHSRKCQLTLSTDLQLLAVNIHGQLDLMKSSRSYFLKLNWEWDRMTLPT